MTRDAPTDAPATVLDRGAGARARAVAECRSTAATLLAHTARRDIPERARRTGMPS
ncbi:Uncharacterised protein [Xylophilus ampelinus]|nr:hypothetical protein [Variovorax sp.]VTY29118.1 Uncharacterised protein [Xylophilus ampelinus]